jgi:hypothetical protein
MIMYKNRASTAVIIALLIAVAGTVSGCLWAPDLAGVRKDIERQLPGVHFEKKIELTLGRVAIAFARLITRFVPEAREAGRYLHDINRVAIAVYETEAMPAPITVSMPKSLKRLKEKDDWELAVRTCQDDESMWLLCRIEKDEIREVFLVVLSEDELVIVRSKGRLDRVVAAAIYEAGKHSGLPSLEDAF